VLVLLVTLTLSGCIPLKPPFTPAHVEPPPPPPNAAFSTAAAPLVVSFTDQSTA
jgi:hypothetical protein